MTQKTDAAEAVALLRRALTIDPDNVDAMVGIATPRIYQLVNQYQIADRTNC